MGAETLAKPSVQAEIKKVTDASRTLAVISVDRITEELATIAFSDITNFTDFSAAGVALKNSQDIDEITVRALAEVKESSSETTTSVSIKLHDKVKALQLLGKYKGMELDLNQAIAFFRRYGWDVWLENGDLRCEKLD